MPSSSRRSSSHRNTGNSTTAATAGSNSVASTRSAHSLLTTGTSSSSSHAKQHTKNANTTTTTAVEDDHPDLVQLEAQLTEQVEEEFFEEPRKFHTLHRVIDVLGMQLESTTHSGKDNTSTSTTTNNMMNANPAYQKLVQQQRLVEDAIEHLALIHCADLNGSVVQVGRVARQFQEAVGQVRHLRGRVQDIQETLGSSSSSSTTSTQQVTTTTTTTKGGKPESTLTTVAAQNAMSLRELWLQKLEAEAVLSLLEKLDKIRAAPRLFDTLLQEQRLGAAVVCVSQALSLMFSSDVSQVQALHKIMEQLMMRKQYAEEVVWEVLLDTLFLRTANGKIHQSLLFVTLQHADAAQGAGVEELLRLEQDQDEDMSNPFFKPPHFRYCLDWDLQVDHPWHTSTSSHGKNKKGMKGTSTTSRHVAPNNTTNDWQLSEAYAKENMMIPPSLLEAEFDLESEEKQHLEEWKDQQSQWTDYHDDDNSNNHNHDNDHGDDDHDEETKTNDRRRKTKKPHYGDSLLALRTLVDCLIRLRRLDDVDRLLTEALPHELERLVQREQARTFVRMEQESSLATTLKKMGGAGGLLGTGTDLTDFRKQFEGMIAAFGNVQLRMAHLAQIIRHRLTTDKSGTTSNAYNPPSSALAGSMTAAKEIMEAQLKTFLDACLHASEDAQEQPEFNIHALTNVSGQSRQVAAKTKAQRESMGLFSLGIVEGTNHRDSAALTAEAWLTASTASKRTKIQTYETPKFVTEILFAKSTQQSHNSGPQIRHALYFRRSLAQWHHDSNTLRKQLSQVTLEDRGTAGMNEVPALEYLDVVIQKDLLPVLQEEAVNGTVQALERPDAFDPVLDRNVYSRQDSNEPQDVDMCRACNALYTFTGPLFLALHRLPKGGEMYLPLVAVLEHVLLTFISRVKQQVQRLCQGRTALALIMETTKNGENGVSSFGAAMERRKAFAQLVLAYADGDLLDATTVSEGADAVAAGVPLISPSGNDSPSKAQIQASRLAALGMEDLDFVGGVEREEMNLTTELQFVKPFLEFAGMEHNSSIQICTDEILMKSACLSHSLLKLSSLLDTRCKVRSSVGGMATKTLSNTRALREAIKTIKANGLKMAKFCRADALLQAITRLAKVCNSSTVVARDAVRIPSSVNDLGEYMTAASDNLREAAGNAVTAYTFSTLEQYIPLCLIQTVRVLAAGKGIVTKAPLTMNGIEALDRSGSVLYRDLKGATSFDNSFWDIELAAVSFERSASFIAMMELEMAELEAYYQENRDDFSEQDFQLMFSMNGPRRKGDIGKYHMVVKRLDTK